MIPDGSTTLLSSHSVLKVNFDIFDTEASSAPNAFPSFYSKVIGNTYERKEVVGIRERRRISSRSGPTGTALRTRKTVIVQDWESDPNIGRWRERALRNGYRSSVSIPIMDSRHTTGGFVPLYRNSQRVHPRRNQPPGGLGQGSSLRDKKPPGCLRE